jgi:hypothetical protein
MGEFYSSAFLQGNISIATYANYIVNMDSGLWNWHTQNVV